MSKQRVEYMKKWSIIRLSLILLLFAFFYFLLITKLFYWQVMRAADLKKAGRAQSTEVLTTTASRGNVLTSDQFPLVTNKYTYLLYANPKVVTEKDIYAKKLSSIIEVEEASIAAQLSKNLYWVRLAWSLEESKKSQIEGLKLPGIGFQKNSMRYYPEASMAAQLVGFIGKDRDGFDRGYFGLEGYYNEQLQGRPGQTYVIKDALGNTILNDIREEKKIDGRTLVLNIDRTIQHLAEKRLKEGIVKYEAEGGSVIIMEPQSGKVLGMVSYPRFNPQKYYESPGEYYKNPVITGLYEPGSTFKVLIMAAGIDLKKVTPDTKCDICDGPIQVGEYKIKTWNDKYFPRASMTDVLVHSDNTGMVFVGKKLGLDNVVGYLKRFGLGEDTGIDLQGEVSGEVRDRDLWYAIDLATTTFGQGVSITPMQLLNAVSAIANDGILMKPQVVSKIITEQGREIEIKPEEKRQVISSTTAKVVTWMMVEAVEKGEAKWVKLKEYKVAGKTGTAQIPVAGHYDPDQTIASFVGFFPADEPKISMLVLVDRPKKSIYGSETAAPIFFNIAHDIINYYKIPPSY